MSISNNAGELAIELDAGKDPNAFLLEVLHKLSDRVVAKTRKPRTTTCRLVILLTSKQKIRSSSGN
jgi:hypothetical protein